MPPTQQHYIVAHRETHSVLGWEYTVDEVDEWGRRVCSMKFGPSAVKVLAEPSHAIVSDPSHWLSTDGRVEPELDVRFRRQLRELRQHADTQKQARASQPRAQDIVEDPGSRNVRVE